MSTFSEFITNCNDRVDNKNTRTTPYLKAATVRWLKEVSVIRTLFMEEDFLFTLVANQFEYSSADTGFPANVIEFDRIWVQETTGAAKPVHFVEGPVTARLYKTLWQSKSRYPEVWFWDKSSLRFAPVPSTSGVLAIGFYLQDATKDTASGATITTASTTQTNGWFDRGEQILMNAVLWDYHNAISKDRESAQMCRELYLSGIATLQREWDLRNMRNSAAGWCFGDDDMLLDDRYPLVG